MKKILVAAALLMFVSALLPVHGLAQPFDYGDAPEDALAYPSLGVIGFFPTCLGGSAAFIRHTNFGAWFGSQTMVDFELDGNANNCPPVGFPPYDQDECFQDPDAGLLFPPAYTINQTPAVVPCVPGAQGPLGITCLTAIWGAHIDIDVENHMPSHEPFLPAYVNVLIDWNQDGVWGGFSPCPPTGTPAPEHVLVDFVVPPLYSGPLSMLLPPSFLIGPNPGYVWVRFSITEAPVGSGWDGSGSFEDGESEDYLLLIDGDQPTIFPEEPTECPVIDTECPVLETECPASATKCPVVETFCPVIETECPVIETACPVVETRCPVDPTFCPVIETECPAEPTICAQIETECPDPTLCPPVETHCPSDPTFCPIIDTQCPADPIATVCPEIATECPVVETACPVMFTYCPDLGFTYCPEDPTWCPIFFTECPMEPTFCPTGQTICEFTICDVIPTWCPEEPTLCPVDPTICADVPTVCPDLQTVCPEVITICPVTPTVCETPVQTVCPTDPTNCPVVSTSCPSIPTSCPADPTLCVTVDTDGDGIEDCNDNCPNKPNGPSGGTCTIGNVGDPCTVPGPNVAECGASGYCSMAQEDSYPPGGGNGCGDACECEGNFDDDQDQDGADAAQFKIDFGRLSFFHPCINSDPCNGDFDCDGDVDGEDAAKFKEDFGRLSFFNPCPICPTDPWCVYSP